MRRRRRGQRLTFTFDATTHLTSVGLIGGYVKVDPLTGVDRFPQNHRVRQVRWTFSDGSTVTQDLADSRDLQSIPVDVTTTIGDAGDPRHLSTGR